MKTLKIDENYKIQNDDNNCVLIHSELKIAEKGKNIGEEYLSETPYYYPTVNDCLKKYLQLAQKEAESVEDCVRITEETYRKIKNLKF